MRLLLICIVLLFVQGLSAQPKPYQEVLISIVHTTSLPVSNPSPKYIVEIKNDLSICYYNDFPENYKPDKKVLGSWIVDSTLVFIEKSEFMELSSAFGKLNFDSLYVPKIKSEDSIVKFESGGAWNDYVVKTSMRIFTIGEGKERDEVYSEALLGFISLIADIEEKYKPRD